jgi:hypothetical protein
MGYAGNGVAIIVCQDRLYHKERLNYGRRYCGHFHARKNCGKLLILHNDAVVLDQLDGALRYEEMEE